MQHSLFVEPLEHHPVGTRTQRCWQVVSRWVSDQFPECLEFFIDDHGIKVCSKVRELTYRKAQPTTLMPCRCDVQRNERSEGSVVAVGLFVHEHGETGQCEDEMHGLVVSRETQAELNRYVDGNRVGPREMAAKKVGSPRAAVGHHQV